MPTVTCPHCHSGLSVDSRWSGKDVRCPLCGANFRVPGPPSLPEAELVQPVTRVEFGIHQPMQTSFGAGFGGGLGWALGGALAFVIIIFACCGGLGLFSAMSQRSGR